MSIFVKSAGLYATTYNKVEMSMRLPEAYRKRIKEEILKEARDGLVLKKQIYTKMKISPPFAEKLIRELESEGKIEIIRSGRYKLIRAK
ncbi:MAG: hypothetical protein QXP84_07435 [Candidatus Korarchaeum sp.]